MNNIFKFQQKTDTQDNPLCYLPDNSFNTNFKLNRQKKLDPFLDKHFTKHTYDFDDNGSSDKY